MLHSQRRLISEGRVFPSHSMEAVVYLSEVNCLQGKQSQPCLQPSRWDGVTVDAGVSRHSPHEMKIGFDPPGWEIQMRNLLVSRILCNKPEPEYNWIRCFQTWTICLKSCYRNEVSYVSCRNLAVFLAAFTESERGRPDSELSTAKSICCLILKLNHIL